MFLKFGCLLTVLMFLASCGSEDSNLAAASGNGGTTTVSKKIFITAASFNGDLVTAAGGGANGIVAADTLCQAEAASNGITTAKALISDNLNRIACSFADCSATDNAEHVDWVLEANMLYTRVDGTEIGTTNATKLFDVNVTSFANSVGAGWVWTGLGNDWTSLANCQGWTSSNNGMHSGQQGDGSSLDGTAINGGGAGCGGSVKLYCVEQ